MQITNEEWRIAQGFELYEVSDRGRIRNRETGRVLRPRLGNHGYIRWALFNGSRDSRTSIYAHVLVARTFLGDPAGMEVDHLDGAKQNNHVTNLQYVSRRENCKRAYDKGLNPGPPTHRGEKQWHSKLSSEDVRSIRSLHDRGTETQAIATLFSIHPHTVNKIVARKSWNHV